MEGEYALLKALEEDFRSSQARIQLLEDKVALSQRFHNGKISEEAIKLQDELKLETTRQQLLNSRRVELQNNVNLLRKPLFCSWRLLKFSNQPYAKDACQMDGEYT